VGETKRCGLNERARGYRVQEVVVKVYRQHRVLGVLRRHHLHLAEDVDVAPTLPFSGVDSQLLPQSRTIKQALTRQLPRRQ
jgi:hypothetical protein